MTKGNPQTSIFDMPGLEEEQKAFHNTNAIEGAELAKAEASAETMNAQIRTFFASQPKAKFAAHEVFNALAKTNKKLLLSSVRRSVTNLFNGKKLIKTDETVTSKHGATCKRYQWNTSVAVTEADLQN